MVVSVYVQDPNDVQDYAVDWTLAPGDTITASTWTPDVGVTVHSEAFANTPIPQTVVWVSVAAAGTTVNIVNHITTAQGRQKDHTITIQCQEE